MRRRLERSRVDRETLAQFLRFLAVGLLNAGFGYAVFSTAVLAGVSAMPGLVLAYALGVPFNFVTTGKLVFADRGRASLARFIAAYGVVYVFNAAIYHALAAAGVAPLAAQAVCLPVVAIFAFLLFKLQVFRADADPGAGDGWTRRPPGE